MSNKRKSTLNHFFPSKEKEEEKEIEDSETDIDIPSKKRKTNNNDFKSKKTKSKKHIHWEEHFVQKPLKEKHVLTYFKFDIENDCVECTVCKSRLWTSTRMKPSDIHAQVSLPAHTLR